jgi:tRNA nucleotidyltransferase/poly(A) polymerase
MCQLKEEGGRRCAAASLYSHSLRNVKAKEQYWKRKIAKTVDPEQQAKIQTTIQAATDEVTALKKAHELYGAHVTSYDIEMTPAGQKVIDALYDSGLNPLVVGGSVRDRILGLSSKDLDIEVYGGTTEEVLKSLRKVGKVDEVGKSFGVLKIVVDGEDLDVSLPRTDNKLGEGHRGFEVSVDPYLSPERASQRRDYTINSLLYDTKNRVIIDPNGGLEDLKKKSLRHISDAFDEDPLRVLRGVQMASRFGFEMAPETAEKSQNLKKEFAALSNERVRIEFQKLYAKGKNSRLAFQTLQATGWDDCFPGLKGINNEQLWNDLSKTDNSGLTNEEKQIFSSAIIAGRLSPTDAEFFLQKTVTTDSERSAIRNILAVREPKELDATTMRRWAHNIGPGANLDKWTRYQEFIGNANTAKNVREKAIALNLLYAADADFVQGKDIIALFPDAQPGRWVGNIMRTARARQEENVFRTNESGIEWVKKNFTVTDIPELNK